MTESEHSFPGNIDADTMENQLNDIRINSREIKGFITRYILNTKTVINEEKLKRETFGEKDNSKPHKTVLLVGETGTGKSTLINAMVTYMLGVKCDDRIWCEIIETNEIQTESQTKAVTVYDVFTEASPISLTIIDTPGFGSTEGKEGRNEDLKMIETLDKLFRSNRSIESKDINEINAVCLIVSSNTTRLTSRQLYIFNVALTVFSRDVENNIVVFITHAPRKPWNAINAIKHSKIPCAKNDKEDPVYFRADNFHCENFDDEEIAEDFESAWNLFSRNMKDFQNFLEKKPNVNLNLTKNVLKKREELKASIHSLRNCIKEKEKMKKPIQQIKTDLEKLKKQKIERNNFEIEVKENYKVKEEVDSQAMCCSVCEENCHYPGCWWVKDLSWCSVMLDGRCTVCPGKCHYSKHVKEKKIYQVRTMKVKVTNEVLKREYENKVVEKKSLLNKLEDELKELEKKEARLVEESYQCVDNLEENALKTVDAFMFEHLDFLIQKVKETEQTKRVQKLEELKKKAKD